MPKNLWRVFASAVAANSLRRIVRSTAAAVNYRRGGQTDKTTFSRLNGCKKGGTETECEKARKWEIQAFFCIGECLAFLLHLWRLSYTTSNVNFTIFGLRPPRSAKAIFR